MGALFAVAYCVLYGRVGNLSPRSLSVVLACGMFLSLYVIPFLKYPPNPPATSLEETIRQRTLLYLLMVVLSAALLVAAVYLGHRLVAQYGRWSATLIGAGAYVVAIAVVMLVLPTIDETPGDFSAEVLYDFRLYSLGTQFVLWAMIGLVFGSMADRLLRQPRRESIAA
jgi:predicted cobalt transporter CbtA